MEQGLYTAEQVRELDRLAIEEHGIPGLTLMERAGQAGFDELQQCWPEARHIVVVCGLGNNAGDGYVLARLAYRSGLSVTVVQLGDEKKLQGDARSACEAMKESGLVLQTGTDKLPDADVYVDALFGTGLDRDVDGEFRNMIEQVNAQSGARLAIDIPSGLHADTGRVMGA
ncbi:MAG: NAD(P)H-hydrate epimerase, partial [Gammaproteobacteria bacterium]|nr:NAD(P)H-hydrate epimerase [Gammaproteobacteria bacterium]